VRVRLSLSLCVCVCVCVDVHVYIFNPVTTHAVLKNEKAQLTVFVDRV